MIVKDEEKFLDRCLSSVKGVVDEMVVVDTGSTDLSVYIAKSYGASVHPFTWTGSFSDARNAALEHATGDWVLVMDADEELDVASKAVILDAVAHPTADAYELTFRNYITDGENPDVFTHRTCRLFRNDSRYRFIGSVHETINTSIEDAGGKVAPLDAIVHHKGYQPSLMMERDKHQRYTTMLLDELRSKPDDVYTLYNLGVTYVTAGEYENAIIHLDRAANLVPAGAESASRIFTCLAKSLIETGRPDEALKALEQSQKDLPHPELNYCKGSALMARGEHAEAMSQFRQALDLGKTRDDWSGDAGAYGYKALYGIASAAMALEDYSTAMHACLDIIDLKPDDCDTFQLLAETHFRLEQYEAARAHIEAVIELQPDNAQAYTTLGSVLAKQGHLADSLQHLAKAVEIDPKFAEAYLTAGDVLYSFGRFQEAADVYSSALAHDPTNAEGFIALGNCYFGMRAYEAAAMAYGEALRLQPDNLEASDNLAAADRATMHMAA